MVRFGLLLCALALSGCGLTALDAKPDAEVPPEPAVQAGEEIAIATQPVQSLDCETAKGRIICD